MEINITNITPGRQDTMTRREQEKLERVSGPDKEGGDDDDEGHQPAGGDDNEQGAGLEVIHGHDQVEGEEEEQHEGGEGRDDQEHQQTGEDNDHGADVGVVCGRDRRGGDEDEQHTGDDDDHQGENLDQDLECDDSLKVTDNETGKVKTNTFSYLMGRRVVFENG